MAQIRRMAFLIAASAAGTCAASDTPAWLHIGPPQPVEIAQTAYYELVDGKLRTNLKLAQSQSIGDEEEVHPGSGEHLAGRWGFFMAPGEKLPSSASRMRLSSNGSYRVDVDLYCEGQVCENLAGEFRRMDAPRPKDEQNRAVWRKIVAAEPCDALAPAGRGPIFYPREELRRGIEGTVVLSVFHNRCGDVREVAIAKSSGNRRLDGAALMQSHHWRVQPLAANVAGWKQETLEFRVGDQKPNVNGSSIRSVDD